MRARLLGRLLLAAAVALPGLAYAHGGGLDANGCHMNRKTGDYHCHRSSYAAPATAPKAMPQSNARSYAPAMPVYPSVDDTCYTGPRGGRYRIVNGKKRYGC